jgi:adenylate cyclase class 2
MKTEFEVRMLDISFETMNKKLEAVGAKRQGAFYQMRYTYDFTPPRKGQWIRLRSNGQKTTLAIKEIKAQQIDGTKELEIVVSDFEDTNSILEKIGYKAQRFEENFRITFTLGKVEVALDKWPMIPPLMEIEGESEEDVLKFLDISGIDKKDVSAMDIDTLYKEKYGIDLSMILHLKFTDEEQEFINRFR